MLAKPTEWVKNHRKFLVAAAGVVALIVQSYATDSSITQDEWVAIVLAALAAVGVERLRNGDKPPADPGAAQ